jgi:hypothetical protein
MPGTGGGCQRTKESKKQERIRQGVRRLKGKGYEREKKRNGW